MAISSLQTSGDGGEDGGGRGADQLELLGVCDDLVWRTLTPTDCLYKGGVDGANHFNWRLYSIAGLNHNKIKVAIELSKSKVWDDKH